MKPAIPIAGAFALGLAGASFVGMKQPAAPVPVEAASAKAPAAEAPHSDSTVKPTDSVTLAAHAPDSAVVPVKPDSVAAAPPATTATSEHLAAIYAKLAPADIVVLSATMNDDELTPVLKHLDMATTASVLALMPAARAKTLSKKLLVPSTTSKP